MIFFSRVQKQLNFGNSDFFYFACRNVNKYFHSFKFFFTYFLFSIKIFVFYSCKMVHIFQLGTTPFDKENGRLEPHIAKSVWRANNFHDKQMLPIVEADVPIRSPLPSKRIRTENMYIEFTPTDMHKDIAQTTGE